MFTHVVALYRASGRPALEDGSRFTYEGPTSNALTVALRSCEGLGEVYGGFEDEPEINDDVVTFTWRLAANEHARFYGNASELIDRSTRPSRGEQPNNYYLVAEDYLVGEVLEPQLVSRLNSLIALIKLLGALTTVVPTTANTPSLLVFVQPAHDRTPPRTLEIPTRITSETAQLPTPDLTELRLLSPDEPSTSLHTSERRALFRLAVAETLGKAPETANAFHYLVNNWGAVLEKYGYDVDCYVANFSFDKARKEIAATELDFVTKMHGIVGDSTAKLLGLPLSLAALVAIYTGKTMLENYLYLLSILCVSALFSLSLGNQSLQLRRIRLGFNTVFAQFKDRPELYAGKLTTHIDTAVAEFNKQYRFATRATWLLRVTGWAPSLAGTAFVAYRYSPAVKAFVLSF